ncbi:MAG TPA: aldo/keto reductase, partial [Pseudonocardia sp.]|nr:aldo/keto reductase [Pseudonocardia sp.]
ALAEAAAAGAQVIVKEPVANGRLAPGGADPADERATRAAALASDLGVPVDQLAIAAAMAQPWAWCVLSGAVHPDQVRSNAAATALTVPPDLLDELTALAEPPVGYWAARSARPWS